ncbi:CD40 ligand [Epinephelus fuscoguttatus]|uniref:CD40 ligand n=1 Tax=Epinephelus fuscoguttatus TaxID=293821 RepID=UPI0020D0347C|nr:CD40 ligand [Epinephelus fuscoguttatus]
MINTYQTSLAPPPVPPRLGKSHQVLIPTPLSGHSKSLIRFLVGAVLLQLFLSVGGFILLYHNDQMLLSPEKKEAKAAALMSDKQETSAKVLARMFVKRPQTPDQKSKSGYLQWDWDHSTLRNTRPFIKSWLTILQSGDYYVYSRVTFSKGDPKVPLATRVMLRKSESDKEEKVLMQAYCSLDSSGENASISHPCTATQGEVVTLEEGNQLGVWIQGLSLVDFEERATTFGMYKL